MVSFTGGIVADEERDGDYTGHYGIGLIPCIPPDYVRVQNYLVGSSSAWLYCANAIPTKEQPVLVMLGFNGGLSRLGEC